MSRIFDPKRLRRRLTIAVAFVLAPLLIASFPFVAEAAVVYGSPVTSSPVKLSTWRVGDTLSCKVSAYYVVDGTKWRIRYKGTCSMGWNAASGGTMTEVEFKGSSCSDVSFDVATTGDAPIKFSGQTAEGPMSMKCNVTDVCLSYKVVRNNMFDTNYEKRCAALNLGLPPTSAGESCTYGGPAARPELGPVQFKQSAGGRWGWYVDVTVRMKDTSTGNWYPYVTYAPPAPGQVGTEFTGETLGTEGAFSRGLAQNALPGTNVWQVAVSANSSIQGSAPTAPQTTIVGAGVFRSMELNGTVTAQSQNLPQANSAGILALSDKAKCSYYWGQKFADLAATDTDEPLGDLTAPDGGTAVEPVVEDPAPEPSEETCTFSWSDPASWASAGICALVQLMAAALDVLQSILAALGELAAAIFGPIVAAVGSIAGAILDGLGAVLKALFAPNPETWGWRDLKTDLQGRPPFSLIAAVADIFSGVYDGLQNSGECGNLIEFGDGLNVSCSTVKSAPVMGVLYNLVAAGLIGLTAWGVFSMVARSVGGKQ